MCAFIPALLFYYPAIIHSFSFRFFLSTACNYYCMLLYITACNYTIHSVLEIKLNVIADFFFHFFRHPFHKL